jgi:hypothetical protein
MRSSLFRDLPQRIMVVTDGPIFKDQLTFDDGNVLHKEFVDSRLGSLCRSTVVVIPSKKQKVPITYLLTFWCRGLPERLAGSHLAKIFPAFHKTRMFITTFTSARHLSLS